MLAQVWVDWGNDVTAWLESLPQWQALLVTVGGSVLVAMLIQVGGDPFIRRVSKRIPGTMDDIVLRAVHLPLYITVVLVGLYLAREPLSLSQAVDTNLAAAILSILVVVWGFTLIRIGRKVSTELTNSDAVDKAVVPIFQNVWTAVILGGAIFLLLTLWRIDVTPLLASAGIIGIIVGLAARDTIANFFGSLALYIDGTYKVGDYIVLESGERGRVEDISIRSTVIRTRDDILVTIPNSVLNNSRIINESGPKRERRIRIPVGVGYESDLDYVEEVLLEVAAENDQVKESPAPRVRFRGFGDSAVDLELLCWIRDPVLRGRGTHLLVKDVHASFRENGVEIPFPHRDVTLTEVTEVTLSDWESESPPDQS
jgi:MscS family membrane protein